MGFVLDVWGWRARVRSTRCVRTLQDECVQHLWSAAKHYKEALKADRGNIYAANGLGAVCATMGQMDAARQIFNLLRESAATLSGFVRLPDVRPPAARLT